MGNAKRIGLSERKKRIKAAHRRIEQGRKSIDPFSSDWRSTPAIFIIPPLCTRLQYENQLIMLNCIVKHLMEWQRRRSKKTSAVKWYSSVEYRLCSIGKRWNNVFFASCSWFLCSSSRKIGKYFVFHLFGIEHIYQAEESAFCYLLNVFVCYKMLLEECKCVLWSASARALFIALDALFVWHF